VQRRGSPRASGTKQTPAASVESTKPSPLQLPGKEPSGARFPLETASPQLKWPPLQLPASTMCPRPTGSDEHPHFELVTLQRVLGIPPLFRRPFTRPRFLIAIPIALVRVQVPHLVFAIGSPSHPQFRCNGISACTPTAHLKPLDRRGGCSLPCFSSITTLRAYCCNIPARRACSLFTRFALSFPSKKPALAFLDRKPALAPLSEKNRAVAALH
jgi:hypothetical protein